MYYKYYTIHDLKIEIYQVCGTIEIQLIITDNLFNLNSFYQ